MALADDPQKHILHMFKMAMHDRAEGCEIFPDGARIDGLPLGPQERVYGAYRNRFFFSPSAFFWLSDHKAHRLDWGQVKSCATSHGSGDKKARLTLIDGSKVTVPVAEFTIGWGSRIGQLFYAMIDRWRAAVRDEHHVLTIDQFFQLAKTDDAISPNWYPDHPGLERMRDWLRQLEQMPGVSKLLLVVTDYDDGQPCVQEVMVLSSTEPSGPAVDRLRFSWLSESAAKTVRLAGPIPFGAKAFSGVWD